MAKKILIGFLIWIAACVILGLVFNNAPSDSQTTQNVGEDQHSDSYKSPLPPPKEPIEQPVTRVPPEVVEAFRKQGYTDEQIAQAVPVNQPQQQPDAVLFLDQFMGSVNASIPVYLSDLLSIKTDQLKFRFAGQTYNYSGHYAIMIPHARKHSAPLFGSPEKVKIILIQSSGLEMPLANATVWEKSSGFIDAETDGHEFICSGSFMIQN